MANPESLGGEDGEEISSTWGSPSYQSRGLSKRYQITFRYVTNKVILVVGVAVILSMILNLGMIWYTVTTDVEQLYAADGSVFSCFIPEPSQTQSGQ